MTRQIGQLVGNHLGEYVLTDQSRKSTLNGSILRIRIAIDIPKPLGRSILIKLEENVVEVAVRYEKLVFLCGLVDHLEDQCERFKGRNDDDLSKAYGRWFRDDVLTADYRKPHGKRFGLGPSPSWVMKAPLHVDAEEMSETQFVGAGG